MRNARPTLCLLLLSVVLSTWVLAGDVPGSKDPPGMKRYEGSQIIGYRAPRFDEFELPLGRPTQVVAPTVYEKSLRVEGLVSRYTYVAPPGRSPAELFRNYKAEFQRLGLVTLYEKAAGAPGWFGPSFVTIANEDDLGSILRYNEAQERVIVGKSSEAKPTYYYVFVTGCTDLCGGLGVPKRLAPLVDKSRALAEVIVIAPQQMEEKMTFVNADEMSRSLASSGKVALYGIYFDTDKDTLRPDSQQTLQEISKLLKNNPQLKIHVVGHTDNQGAAEHNLDLSRRRAASVVRELTTRYAVAAARLDPFGCGWYAPVASNDSEEGRAKNRRVELVKW